MAATYYLCASHGAGNRPGQELLRELASALPRGFRACHVGCFHGDDPRWSASAVRFLESLGARCAAPVLSDPEIDRAEARAAIEQAELVYLAGGDTVAGVAQIRARGLLDAFAVSARSASVVFGVSGGACAAAPCTIGYGAGDRPCIAECLGVGSPLPLDVHDERDDWPEMRALLELGPPQGAGIVIPTGGVLRIGPEGELATYAGPACEIRRLARDGSWRIERL